LAAQRVGEQRVAVQRAAEQRVAVQQGAAVQGAGAGAARARGGREGGESQALVIAVDGPSGSGKSSAACGAAMALGLRYLDTGAMYRAVTWWLLTRGVDLADAESVAEHTRRLGIDVSTDPARQHVRVDGIDVTAEIRSRPVTSAVSQVAAIPAVRSHLIAMQQAIISAAARTAGGIVAEGRDIGTVVAPDAAVKVFLTASEQARAERRAAQLDGRVDRSSADRTRHEQARRDRRDAPQSQAAADAIEIDGTNIGLDEVVARIVGLAKARASRRREREDQATA
jgi:cytidylate kinase